MAEKSRGRKPSEEERAERRAATREKVDAAIEALRTSEGWGRWLRVRRHFHTYSFRNQILIASQCPDATRVAGFKQWLAIGYAVRKGERSIKILAPCLPSKKALARWRREGADRKAKPRMYFRLASVFDRSQVEAIEGFPGGPAPLDPPSVPIDGEDLARLFEPLCEFAASIAYGVSVEAVPGRGHGSCDREARRIVVDEVSATFSPNAQISVLVHELAHALVVVDHTDGDPELGYAEEEVVVECVAFTVCAGMGLDTGGTSIPYMTGWSRGGEVERFGALIDRLARRLEGVVLQEEDAVAPGERRLVVAG